MRNYRLCKSLFLLIFISTFIAAADTKMEDLILNNAKTLSTVDGDSINIKMRLFGIDAPEIGQKCRQSSGAIVDCGVLAHKYLRDLLDKTLGQIYIEAVGKGYYGRNLVRVFRGDVNIGKQMVLNGMAFSYKDIYKTQQDTAQAQKNGFWGFDAPPINPYKWRKQNKRPYKNHKKYKN